MTLHEKTKSLLVHPRFLLGLWMVLAIVASLTKMHRCNNFLIFKGVFYHLMDKTSLFAPYPDEYFDVNHYGPFFSLVIAPFAVMPHPVGLIFWNLLMVLFLFVFIRKLPISSSAQIFILWYCAHELLTALFMQQFNIVIAAIIIGSYILIRKERDTTAALLIVVGTFVKLYGIVGLAFFFFSRHKLRFIVSLIGWSIVCFLLPMLISSPEYVVNQYKEWFFCLGEKNMENGDSIAQNISLLGFVHRVSGLNFSDLYLILPGILIFALPYLRFKQYDCVNFQLGILASVLMFVVLFSTGSESSTYIIALSGVAVWYISSPEKRGKTDLFLLIFAFLLTSMSPSDLFPKYLRTEYIQPYALKALPVILIWCKQIYELTTAHYVKEIQ